MKKFLIACIQFYQCNISHAKLYSRCRFTPTCSEYAILALQKHGLFKGCLLAIWRILRCNPFAKGGYDPVP